jgi:hypothetical protein
MRCDTVQSDMLREDLLLPSSWQMCTRNLVKASLSKMPVRFYQTKSRQIPEDTDLQL